MRSSQAVVEILAAPSIRAPGLARVAEALFAYAQNPADRRARIAVALLEKQGALDCPACGMRFDVEGYRETRTCYAERASLACVGCRTRYVVHEAEFA